MKLRNYSYKPRPYFLGKAPYYLGLELEVEAPSLRAYEHGLDFMRSPRLISFVLFPERLSHNTALFKERRKDGRYYNRAKHTKAMRDLRRYKQRLYKKGEL